MFVRLTPAFLEGICTDNDPAHPNGPDVIITKGKGGDRPVFEVSQNTYIKDKIREGILEEVRDFDGTPRNDPEHPDHPDNPESKAADPQAPVVAGPVQGYSEDDVQAIVAKALAAQADRNAPGQQQAIDAAVTKALAAQSPKGNVLAT
jgi:hypothetical protein